MGSAELYYYYYYCYYYYYYYYYYCCYCGFCCVTCPLGGRSVLVIGLSYHHRLSNCRRLLKYRRFNLCSVSVR